MKKQDSRNDVFDLNQVVLNSKNITLLISDLFQDGKEPGMQDEMMMFLAKQITINPDDDQDRTRGLTRFGDVERTIHEMVFSSCSIGDLETVKEYCKTLAVSDERKETKVIAKCVYYVAIIQAIILYDKKLTKLDDEKLVNAARSFIESDYLVEEIETVFKQYMCRSEFSS